MKYTLSIIIPTLNEEGNIKPLFSIISKVLNKKNYEIVFVDDNSSDSTVEKITSLIDNHSNIRLIRRPRKRGLSSACIDGFDSCSSKYLAVIDADLQHDPKLLKDMLETLEKTNRDIVVASRFLKGAKLSGLSNAREKLSNVGNYLSNIVTGVHLSDPLSGYFMVRSELIEQVSDKLSAKGFKILLDIFASAKSKKVDVKYSEIPCDFRERNHGESKLDSLVILEFLVLLFDKIFGKHLSVRFVLFLLVGLSGVLVHMSILGVLNKLLNVDFLASQTIATISAMVSNFYINNIFTYRDMKLVGVKALYGLVSFCIACSLGALFNIIIATFLFEKGMNWLLSGFVGIVVGSIWNYTTTSFITWKNIR
ncbi:MAG: glycosyltransferase family 2 protein [Rickettsiales bacterium]